MQRPFQRRYLSSSLVCALICLFMLASAATAGDNEYTGKFESELVADNDDLEQVVFKPLRDTSSIKLKKPIEADSKIAAGRLYHAPSDKSAILTLLVEPEGEAPYLLADVDLNNEIGENERFELRHGKDENPFIWETTISQPLKEGFFKTFPLDARIKKGICKRFG
jgi:hypothetical protein